MPSASDDVVALLPGVSGEGLVVPVDALTLLLSLEERGLMLMIDPDTDALIAFPAKLLTSDDCTAIRRWRCHLRALMAYQPPEVA